MFLANDEGETVNYGHPNNYYNVWGINTDTENKEIVMKFVDWLYSEEGGYLMNYGVEGVHWEMVDGKPQFLDSIIEEYKSRTGDPTYGQVLKLVSVTCSWICPGIPIMMQLSRPPAKSPGQGKISIKFMPIIWMM